MSNTRSGPEALAAACEAAAAVDDIAPTDEQVWFAEALMSGRTLLLGKAAAPGGYCQVLTIAICAKALVSKGVHVITHTDEEAVSEAGRLALYAMRLGLSTAVVTRESDVLERTVAFLADITVGTFGEFMGCRLHNELVDSRGRPFRSLRQAAFFENVDLILLASAEARVAIPWGEPVDTSVTVGLTRFADGLRLGADYVVLDQDGGVVITPAGLDRFADRFGVRDPESVDDVISVGILESLIAARDGLPIGERSSTRTSIGLVEYFAGYEMLAGLSMAPAMVTDALSRLYPLDTFDLRSPEDFAVSDEDRADFAGLADRLLADTHRRSVDARYRVEVSNLRAAFRDDTAQGDQVHEVIVREWWKYSAASAILSRYFPDDDVDAYHRELTRHGDRMLTTIRSAAVLPEFRRTSASQPRT